MGRVTQALRSNERAVYGATVTLVDLATDATETVAYTGMTATDAARCAAAECDRLGPSWRVRCFSTPETILVDLRGGRALVPEPSYMARAGRSDLCEFIPAWDGHTVKRTRRERRWDG